MGDSQSAQRDIRREPAEEEEEEEERGAPEDARVDHCTEEKPLRNNGQISEINGKADSTLAEVDDHCGDAMAAEASLSPEKDVLQTSRPLEEEGTPSENVEMNQKESPDETDAIEELPLEMTEMDAEQNDINESFKRFFNNIGLKLTVKRGSVEKDEIRTDGPDETNQNKTDGPQNTEDTKDEPKSVNAEPDIDQKTQGTNDNDSTTCPTLTSEDALENAEEKTTGAKDESDTETPSPVVEDLKEEQDAALEEEQLHTLPTTSPEDEEVVSPVKRFFTTGIFSGLRKKKKSTGDETNEKELVDMGRKETVETTETTVEVQQDKGEFGQGVQATTVESEHIENEHKEKIISTASAQPMNDGESPPAIPATIPVNDPEMSSKDRGQDSPMKWLLSGSSFRKNSKKQRRRKSSNTMLSDSEEHSDQLMSSTKSAETQKEESPAQPSAEAAGEDDGAWASFKKLVTPKKHMKKSSLTSEEIQISGSAEETKPSEKGEISDNSTEEGKKRKDSSVSWEAVLCGSGRRRSRSRKTSDSEDEKPQVENDNKKQGSPLESSNEVDGTSAASPNVGSPSEGDGGSTWKSFKKLVTPKRKAKGVEESKDNALSDSEITQDDSSFSIKKLLPRKKKKSSETQGQVSSDEAEKEVVSGDEDSDTPAVVPLSEFDTIETEVHIETTADVETHVAKEADYQVQQDLLDQTSQPILPGEAPEPEVKKVQDDKDSLKNETSTALASNEEPEDLTELISTHQQLSDIPEEGFITETNATPASVPEEAAPDDTLAEDLIEITSEAITALEAVDITTEDETEMVSAVSQLSESSNTSGNTTPVPVEYEVEPTEVLLHQVVEAISISPNTVPVCSDEVSSERIVGSVSHEILETFVKEEPAVLKRHSKSDAASIQTGLNVEELEKIDKLTTTAQIEGLSEVTKSVSTQIVSNAPTKEVATAEMAVDEVHEVSVLYPVEGLNELESNNVSQYLLTTQSEANEAWSLEILPEGGGAVEDEGFLPGARQDEKEPPEMNSQEVESTATLSGESTDGGVEEEVRTQIKEQIIDQVQVESQDQPVESDLQELPGVNDATLDSEEGSGQFLEKEVIKEDITAEVTDKLREDTEPNAEYTVEAEKENKLQADAPQTEHAEDPDVLETVQTASLDMQEGSGQLIENEEVKIKDIPADEMVTDKPQEETEPVPEYDVGAETETKLQAGSVNCEDAEEPKVLEAEQTLDSEDGSARLLENVVISEDIPAEETAAHIRQEEKEILTENNVETETESKLQEDSVKMKPAEEPEASQPEPTAMLDPEEGSAKLHEKQVISEVTPAEETATDTPQEGHVETKKENKLQADSGQTEHVEEPKESVTLDLEEFSIQLLEKEVTSDDNPAEETATDKTQEDIKSLTECNIEEETENKLQADAAETEHAEQPEVLEAEPTASLDLEECGVQLTEKEEPREEIPAETTATDKPKQETEPVTECNAEAEEENKLQADAAKTEHAEELVVSETTQAASLDSEKDSVQLPQEEVSEDINAAETGKEDIKQEATENNVELSGEPENKELKTVTPNIGPHQVAEVLGSIQVPTFASEEGSVQSREREVTSETTIEAGTIKDEPKEEKGPLTEVIEPVDAFQTQHVQEPVQEPVEELVLEHVQEPVQEPVQVPVQELVLEDTQVALLDSEEGSAQSLEEEVISEPIPPEETVAHEVARAADGNAQSELSAEDVHVQEPEVLPADVNDTATETEPGVEASTHDHVVKPVAEESSAPTPEPTDSVPVERATQVVGVLNHQALNRNEDQETEGTPQDVHVGQEDPIPEAVAEIQTLTAVCVSSVHDEACSAQVTEINIFSEGAPTPCVENVKVSNEALHEVHLSSVQSSVEEERGQIRGFEVKRAPVEHAVVTQVITCYLKDIAASIPNTLIETTSDSHEPLIDSVASELGFNETNETTTPLVQNYVTKTGEEGGVVRMMNVPSVQFEDNHRIHVQVVDVDVKSANMKFDTVLEVGVTETREVMDMCHKTVQEVDKLSATSETEEKIRCEENKMTIQEVIQHVRESSPETVPESELVNTEQDVIKETDAVTETTEIPESESSEVEGQKVVEDKERQDEGYEVLSEDSATGQVFENLLQTTDIPGGLDVLIDDPKEDLEDPKAEVKKSEADVPTTELSSEGTKINEEAQTPQIEIVTANTGLLVPQSTGVISSVGNVESPSSLSIELKFNIQFGHAKEPASPPPSTERTEPMKQTDVAEVGVQVEEPKEEINPAQSEERQKQTEGTEVAVQRTEVPQAADLDSTERPMIINQPALLDVGMQTVEIVEPVEQIKSTERGTPNVQVKETIQTVRQKEKRGVFLSQPLLSGGCDQETKADEPMKHKEEENDQDVWMDAEEDVNNQQETGMSLHEVQEPPQHQAISDQEEKVVLEAVQEIEMITSRIEGEESQEETLEKGETCETESEGEDFAVALESPQTATARITTME